ncbi:hypothetical protein ACTOJ1_001018 [Shigella flexneri]
MTEVLKKEVIHINEEEMLETVPRIGDKVKFTTKKDDLLVAGIGKVRDVKIVEPGKDLFRSHRLYAIECENGEYYPVHSFYGKKPEDTIFLLDNKRVSQNAHIVNIGNIKRNHIYTNLYHEQEAKRNLPDIGHKVKYTIIDNNNVVHGTGEVISRKIRNAIKQEALYSIKTSDGNEIQVYHNSPRATDESVVKV